MHVRISSSNGSVGILYTGLISIALTSIVLTFKNELQSGSHMQAHAAQSNAHAHATPQKTQQHCRTCAHRPHSPMHSRMHSLARL
eukprot:4416844-Pyramimonas_sp.AAC.1